jgi:hypothetical protein
MYVRSPADKLFVGDSIAAWATVARLNRSSGVRPPFEHRCAGRELVQGSCVVSDTDNNLLPAVGDEFNTVP